MTVGDLSGQISNPALVLGSIGLLDRRIELAEQSFDRMDVGFSSRGDQYSRNDIALSKPVTKKPLHSRKFKVVQLTADVAHRHPSPMLTAELDAEHIPIAKAWPSQETVSSQFVIHHSILIEATKRQIDWLRYVCSTGLTASWPPTSQPRARAPHRRARRRIRPRD